nr:sulfakinin [Urechis unicinctus]
MKIDMRISSSTSLAIIAIIIAICACAVHAAPPPSARDDVVKDDVLLIAKLMAPLQQLSRKLEEIQSYLEHTASDREFNMEMAKRQAWDMDYGYGGGRFGKRTSDDKRYDAFGIAGRFGRSVDHVDPEFNH